MTHDVWLAILVILGGAAITGATHHRPLLQNGVQRGLDMAIAVCICLAVGRALRLF